MTGLSDSDLKRVTSGEKFVVGDLEVEFLHTPGSQCFRVGKGRVSGDTLFIQGCGRVDLPGGDAAEMYRTLTTQPTRLLDDTVLCPGAVLHLGHNYGHAPHCEMGKVKQTNHHMRVPTLWKTG